MPKDVGKLFHEETKYHRHKIPRGGGFRFREPDAFKSYPNPLSVVELPPPEKEGGMPLWTALSRRRSRRDYSDKPITKQQLSQLIWGSYGVSGRYGPYYLRTAPSAGALYPVETYLVVNSVDEVEPGIYHYNPAGHKLELLKKGSHGQALARAALGQGMMATASVVFVWTAIPERSQWKYGERAFRYIYMDAGHIGENLYLSAEALGLGCCGVGAFYDDEVNKVIGVDGKEETAVYLGTVGPLS